MNDIGNPGREAGLQANVAETSKVANGPDSTSALLEKLAAVEQYVAELTQKFELISRRVDAVKRRFSAYVGHETALIQLHDGMPLFVDSYDLYMSLHYIDGGFWEQENLETLLSYVKDDTVFIDVGANIGMFTLAVAKRLRNNGRVYAFEPEPKVFQLLAANLCNNGLQGRCSPFNFGLSDEDATLSFRRPTTSIGHNSLNRPVTPGDIVTEAQVKRLDDLLPPDFVCDLVKIDVEGHEARVLNGMHRIIANSPNVKILMEKMLDNVGREHELKAIFDGHGMALFGVDHGPDLVPLSSVAELGNWFGYVLAARPEAVGQDRNRARFTIYSRQLTMHSPAAPEFGPDGVVTAGGDNGQILFHGPYWYLRRGTWVLRVHGELTGAIRIDITEGYGHHVWSVTIDDVGQEVTFQCPRDLKDFECVAVVESAHADLRLHSIEFVLQV